MKHVLLTTTALVALTGAAMAEVTLSGNAQVNYNTYEEYDNSAGDTVDAVSGFATDVEIDASLTGGEAYSASISVELADGAANSSNAAANPTIGSISVSGPFFSMGIGEVNERIFKKIDGMSHIGSDEASDNYSIAINAGDWTLTVGDEAVANGARQNFGVAGTVGGWGVQAQSLSIEDEDGDSGFSAQGSIGGSTIALAYESVGGVEKSGASITVPVSTMTATLAVADTGAADTFWGASVSTSIGDLAVSLGTDSNEQIDASITTTMDLLSLSFGYESNTKDDEALGNGMSAKLGYDLGGGAAAYVTYSEDVNGDDDDAYAHGTRAGISFSF